ATDLADLLVERGMPFRRAHAVVGGLVRHCLTTGTALRELDAGTLRRYSPLLSPALLRSLTPGRWVAPRALSGGSARRQGRRRRAAAAREDGPWGASARSSWPRASASRAAGRLRRWPPSWCVPSPRATSPPARPPKASGSPGAARSTTAAASA